VRSLSLTADYRFLLTKLRLDHILSLREPNKRLQALNKVPNDLSAAYSEILGRIESTDRDLALRILSCLFRARRVLRMDELLEILVVEDSKEDLETESFIEPADVIQCCKSLVLYEESSGIVRFIHETVRDYLKDNIDILPPAAYLANTCLSFLAFKVFDKPCGGKECIEERVRKYKFSLYDAQHWGHHAREAEECPDVQRGIISCFASEGKRNAVLQLEAYANSGMRDFSFPKGHTLLHLLAQTGLARTCSVLLKDKVQPGRTCRYVA
jgi:hypothetical protein